MLLIFHLHPFLGFFFFFCESKLIFGLIFLEREKNRFCIWLILKVDVCGGIYVDKVMDSMYLGLWKWGQVDVFWKNKIKGCLPRFFTPGPDYAHSTNLFFFFSLSSKYSLSFYGTPFRILRVKLFSFFSMCLGWISFVFIQFLKNFKINIF